MSDDRYDKTAVDDPSTQSLGADNAIHGLGASFVHHLFSASKTVLVHDLHNRATQRALSELMVPLRELAKDTGKVTLRIVTDFIVINGIRVAVDPQNYGPFLYLMEEMKKRDTEGMEFLSELGEEEAGRFLKVFFREYTHDDVFTRVVSALDSDGVVNVKVQQWVEREKHLRDTVEEKAEVKEVSNQAFFRTVSLMGEILRAIEQRRAIQVRKAERLTQQMVDIIQTDESILVGLASIKNFDEYTFAHSVNVCILSMLIGDRLRLYKTDIAKLGVAALLHDIGKTYIPQTILNKPGKLDEQDWELMKYHTFFGVKELSRIHALHEISDALFVALQHHVHFNMNGYPRKAGGWDLRLFSRIVTVADYFDAMTTPRVYKKRPLTPDKALRFIFDRSGEIFDPFIAKVFIRAMGVYPIGTVVELDTGEKAVVVRQNAESRLLHRPLVTILSNDVGANSTPVDLAEPGTGDRPFRRSVEKILYDETVEKQKALVFLSE